MFAGNPHPKVERSIVVDAKPKIQETIAGKTILLSTIIVWCLGVFVDGHPRRVAVK